MSNFQFAVAGTLGVLCLNVSMAKGLIRWQKIGIGILGVYWWSVVIYGSFWHV